MMSCKILIILARIGLKICAHGKLKEFFIYTKYQNNLRKTFDKFNFRTDIFLNLRLFNVSFI